MAGKKFTSETISFRQGDSTWVKLRKRAKEDLYFFAATVLGYADKFPLREETHAVPLLFAGRRTGVQAVDRAPYQLILWPRRTGKSSCVTIARSMQLAVRDPETSIMIANEKQELAAEFLDSIKTHFETNELLRTLFPEVIPPDFNKVDWSQTRATLNRRGARPQPTFFAIGVGGALAGKHPDHICCDDLISDEAMENARAGNWTIMERVKRWVNHLEPVLSSSAKPFPTITFIGTRWWQQDVYDHVIDFFGSEEDTQRYRLSMQLSDGRRVSREIELMDNLAIMRIAAIEQGNLVFPEIWSEEQLQNMMQKDPEFSACNLLNEPSNAAVRTFQDEWLRYWRYADAKQRTIVYDNDQGQKRFVSTASLFKVIAVDPAASSGASEGARNAIVVLGTDQESGLHFVLDVQADRSDPKDLVSDVVNMAQRWGVHVVHIELAGQQQYVIQWVEKEGAQRGYGLAVEPLKPGGRNKDLRIGGLVVPFKEGLLYVHSSQTAFIADEYRHYRPGARRRDVLDALAYAIEVSPKPLVGAAMSARARSKKQLESYYRRRGVTGAIYGPARTSRQPQKVPFDQDFS